MSSSRRRHHPLPTAEEAEFIVELWMTGKFSTFDIGRFLRLHESTVDRTIHNARDVARVLYREVAS